MKNFTAISCLSIMLATLTFASETVRPVQLDEISETVRPAELDEITRSVSDAVIPTRTASKNRTAIYFDEESGLICIHNKKSTRELCISSVVLDKLFEEMERSR
jgi:hypothetical protein